MVTLVQCRVVKMKFSDKNRNKMGTNYNITPSLVKLVVKVIGGIVAFL